MVERRMALALALAATLPLALGCDDEEDDAAATGDIADTPELDLEGEAATPPFDVKGDCEGLLLVWFDDDGPHTAESRDEIPDAHRERVRVDSLRLAPEERLDPAFVYLADLRAPGEGGSFAVRKVRREAFEALLDRAAGVEVAAVEGEGASGAAGSGAGAANADVIIYGADWCGACRSAAGFFREHDVAFVEKNIERDPQAQSEMQAKCRRAGVSPSGIPVIDFRGTILTGFDPGRLESLIQRGGAPI